MWAVESDPGTARLIRGNAAELRLPVTVRVATVEKTLAAEPPQRFDVVWADPPYAVGVERLAPVLEAAQPWLADDGLLVVERSARDLEPVWPAEVGQRWQRRYGETMLYFARRGCG